MRLNAVSRPSYMDQPSRTISSSAEDHGSEKSRNGEAKPLLAALGASAERFFETAATGAAIGGTATVGADSARAVDETGRAAGGAGALVGGAELEERAESNWSFFGAGGERTGGDVEQLGVGTTARAGSRGVAAVDKEEV
jgi:hypothetical protein